MKIRSITTFFDPADFPVEDSLAKLAMFAQAAKKVCNKAGFEVQSLRLATSPFGGWITNWSKSAIAELAVDLEQRVIQSGFGYFSLGTAHPEEPEAYQAIPAILEATKNTFVTGSMTGNPGMVSISAVKACSEIIAQAARMTPDGFTNLRFAALGNVPAGSPFLPSAYHIPGEPPAAALALECADLVLETFSTAANFEAARLNLLSRLEEQAENLQKALANPCADYCVKFSGFDFSPAPYPSPTCSSGGALEALGLPSFGLSGSLTAAAFLADTLDRGHWLRAGFNGLMLPVLEDTVLAERAAEGSLTIKDLLLVSAVCGTGLDTIPLPGDSSPAQLAAVLLDVAVMSQRLNKPLTARLMPIPGKSAGDLTGFDFEFFANSRVMALPAEPLMGLLKNDGWIELHPRQHYR